MKRKIIRAAGMGFGVLLLAVAGGLLFVTTALPDAGPPPGIRVKGTAAQVARGRYLANHVAVCMDCHSLRDHSRFPGPVLAGSLGGGGEKFSREQGFPGNFYAPNITPYALGDWTDGELYRAITAGVSKSGAPLFPLMPYHNFGQLDDRDVHAIIAYLRTLPAVQKDVPASEADFPVNLVMRTLPARGRPQRRPDEADVPAYGRYLTVAAGCGECHTQKVQGKPVAGMAFAGGMEFPMPGGILRSPNLTPDRQTGLGRWTATAFVQRFKSYADPAYRAPAVGADGYHTPMPWTLYGGMREADLLAIYAYLRSLPPVRHQVVRYEPRVGGAHGGK
ncbi:MAG TPA: c-type cytochrome [Cytophagales bacterium]